jgi:RNA polymerase sigma factor (sigma-70 family)
MAPPTGSDLSISALYDLVRAYRPYVQAALRNGEDTEDLLHDAFLTVWEAQDRMKDPRAYIAGTVRNMVLVAIRRRVRERARWAPSIDLPTRASDPERLLIDEERRRQARNAIGTLISRDREMLVRFYLLDEPAESIRQDLRLAGPTFRMLKARAMKRAAARYRQAA